MKGRQIDLSLCSRDELVHMLRAEHEALGQVLKIVRERVPEHFRVRKDIEELVEKATDQRPFLATYVRSAEADLERERANRNARTWNRWQEAPA